MPLTDSQRQIIASTAPILAEHGLTLTRHFYDNLLNKYPELRSIFSVTSQLPPSSHQPAALAASLYAYSTHIDDLTPILPVVEKICQKHASLNITADQYSIVGENLLKSMAEILGPDTFTDEVRDAWASGYTQLADIMSGREEAIYSEHDQKQGGWRGWRKMKIVKKVKESDDATSFYFKPADGGAIPDYRPGQYVSVTIDVPELKYKQIRQYSLSDAPPAKTSGQVDGDNKTNGQVNGDNKTDGWQADYAEVNGHVPRYHHDTASKPNNLNDGTYSDLRSAYRITVKRESGIDMHHPDAEAHPGYVSNLLHDRYNEGDVIEMSNPAGEFFLDQDLSDSAPVVLISAGVGLTPVMSMLQTLLKMPNASERKISWIHVARNKAIDPFVDDIVRIQKDHKNVTSKVFHSSPVESEQQGVDYDAAGRPDLGAFDKEARKNLLFLDDKQARYFMCGPNPFMASNAKALSEMGVEDDRVKMELFSVGSVGA